MFIFQLFSETSQSRSEEESSEEEPIVRGQRDQEVQVALVGVNNPVYERALQEDINQAESVLVALRAEIDSLMARKEEFLQLLDETR